MVAIICSMEEMVAFPDVDLVVSATVGDAALGPTIAAIKAGKEIVLVNKEAIIMGRAYSHGLGAQAWGRVASRGQ